MLFTTDIFWEFFSIVLLLLFLNQYYFHSVSFQNGVLLVASYIFYGVWDWRFLFLLLIVSSVSFVAGAKIGRSDNIKEKRMWLIASIVSSLSLLFFFKYFNFFAGSLEALLNSLNIKASWSTLNIILPVGISFFTFQTLTYTIDIYLGRLKWEKNIVNYFTYVAFFPQLVAGPIERASNLLPQFKRISKITYQGVYQGISLIIFGLFLKVVISDGLSPLVDQIFSSIDDRDGGELLLGAIYFSGQIYSDFCGYSTIAIGVSCVMGFRLMTNFKTPYFATSIQDFWRNWHISLSSFFRDYVYIPLGGSYGTVKQTNKNILITFLLSGLWHGANWTFIFWGGIHGFFMVISGYLNSFSLRLNNWMKNILGWSATMIIVLVCWVFFRSPDILFSIKYISKMIFEFELPQAFSSGVIFIVLIFILDAFWWKDVRLERGFSYHFSNKLLNMLFETAVLAIMLCSILTFLVWNGKYNAFVYFQF